MNLTKTLLLIAIAAITTSNAFNCSNHMLNKPWNQWNLINVTGYSTNASMNLTSDANLTFCKGLMNPGKFSCCDANAVSTLKTKFTNRFQRSMAARRKMNTAFEMERTNIRKNLDVLLTIQAKQFALRIDFINASNTFAKFAIKMIMKWRNPECNAHQLRNGSSCNECPLPNQFANRTNKTCQNCPKNAYYNQSWEECRYCMPNSFLKNVNDSYCTTCKQDSNTDFYNGTGCYNCSMGQMPDMGCKPCNGGKFYNRTTMTCGNGCDDMDFWNPSFSKCDNCPADSYFAMNNSRYVNPMTDCMKCNGGNMTKNSTDFYNRTTKMCEACKPSYGNYDNFTCKICGTGNDTIDFFNRTTGVCEQCTGDKHYDIPRQRCTVCISNKWWNDTTSMCACLSDKTWNENTQMCEGPTRLLDDYKPKRVLEIVPEPETKTFLGFDRELAQLKDLDFLQKGLNLFSDGLRSLQSQNNTDNTPYVFPDNSSLNYKNAPMTWNTSKDSNLFRLDGVQANEEDEEKEAEKYGNKTFDHNDTNNYTKKMHTVKQLTQERKKIMKSKALKGLKKLQTFKNRAFNAQKQCFRAVYKFSSTMACQVCSANFSSYTTTTQNGNTTVHTINMNKTNQVLMQEKCFSYIYYFYQLGQVRLDMAIGLEMATNTNAAFLINSFEHVNKALRMKESENMTRGEYNKTIDHLIETMNGTLNNVTAFAHRMDAASKSKKFWMQYFVQPKNCHNQYNCDLSQNRFWDINFVNNTMDDLFTSQYPFNFNQTENFTKDEMFDKNRSNVTYYLNAVGEFLKTGNDPENIFGNDDDKKRRMLQETDENSTSKPDSMTVKYTEDTNVKAIDMENDANSVDMDNATNEYNVEDTAQNNTEDAATVEAINENSTSVPGEDSGDTPTPTPEPTKSSDSGVSVWVWVVLAVLGFVLVLAICGLVAGKMAQPDTHIDEHGMSHTGQ